VDSGDEQEIGALRIYGGPLDLDVAYRAVAVTMSKNVEQVITLTLQKYNSRDSPKDYRLEIHITGTETSEPPLFPPLRRPPF